MNGIHYIRTLMIERLSAEGGNGDVRPGQERHARPELLSIDQEYRRFRRMAENRKRQILDRMLLDDAQPEGEAKGHNEEADKGAVDG